MQLDSWSYEIPFDIQSDSEWKIETTGDFCYAYPESGTGNATVKLCIVDNDDDMSRTGELRVIFPKDSSKNKIYQLKQMCVADYGENSVTINSGNRIYAVGYGYNANAGYASVDAVKKPILRFAKAAEDEVIVIGSGSSTFEIQTYTGSSISKISNDLSTKAHLSGNVGGFTGEIKASFDDKTFSSNNYEYALTYIDMAIEYLYCDANLEEMRDSAEYMTAAAYKAINGLSKTYAGKAGIKKVLQDYGTHMVVRSKMGGRLTYSMWLDISKVTSAYDITAFAEASYKSKVGNLDTGASVDETYKKSYEQNASKCNKKLAVLGGDRTLATKLSRDFSEENLNAWSESLTTENMALVGFSDANESLIPLYELVDEEKYPQRYAEFKAYMEGQEIAQDFPTIAMTYDCGTAAKITIPEFGTDSVASLIKEVSVDGQAVAEICEEYIPVINKNERVKVVYPVLNNRTYYNMGYFLGDESHQPARVSWVDNDLTITTYSEEAYGTNDVIYIKGSNITSSAPDGKVFDGTVKDKTMTGINGYNVYEYPLVKIFNHVWTRMDYQGTTCSDGTDVHNGGASSTWFWSDTYVVGGNTKAHKIFYSLGAAALEQLAPAGWRVASSADYRSLQSTLGSNGYSLPALALNPEGVTGFNVDYRGWCLGEEGERYGEHYYVQRYVDRSDEADYYTSDRYRVSFQKNGVMAIKETNDIDALSIRLIQE